MAELSASRLIFTKFIRPHIRPLVVDRPRLFDTLYEGRRQRLTLVSGPAGSGKSTLLSAWLRQSHLDSAWLSLEPSDNEPTRFLAYLTEALRTFAPEIPPDATSVLASGRKIDTRTFVEGILLPALIEKPLDCVLIIDDVHFITDPSILAIIKTLIHYKPNGLHIVLASRTEPEVGLPTLRAQAQLCEIRTPDLRFRPDEAHYFFNRVMELDLDASMVAALQSRTEGWIAACQLTALRLQKSSDRGFIPDCLTNENTFVADYLVEEVLRHLPIATQEFLLITSVLQRMCDPLCAALIGPNRQAVSLRALEKDNLFVVALDDAGFWYRYHPLLADFLRDRVEKSLPIRVADLHKTASQWFADQGLIQEAVHYAVAAGDQENLAQLIEQRYVNMLFSGDFGILRRGLDALDNQLICRRPRLAIADAWCSYHTDGDADWIESRIERAASALAGERDKSSSEPALFLDVRINILRALNYIRGRQYTAAFEIAERTISGLSDPLAGFAAPLYLARGSSQFAFGDFEQALISLKIAERLGMETKSYPIAFAAIATTAAIKNIRLELGDALEMGTSALRLAKETGDSLLPVVGSVHVELGLCLFYRGQYRDAQVELETAVRCFNLMKVDQNLAVGNCFWARIKLRMGDAESARTALQESLAIANKLKNPDLIQFVLSYQALFDLQRGNLAEAQKWAETVGTEPVSNTVYREHINLVILTVKLYSGSHILEEIDTSIQRNMDQGFLLYAIILRIIKVVTVARLGQEAEAARYLADAVRRAQPEGVRVYFQVWGPEAEWSGTMRKIMAKIADREVRDYLSPLVEEDGQNGLHSLIQSHGGCITADPSLTPSKRIDRLTEREAEVLELLSQGMSYQQIGEKLFVSMATVKTHLQRIYRKLEVKNRTAAIRAAGEVDKSVGLSLLTGEVIKRVNQ
jgi:LuxR family transcriptional regulator, maltose regulon positive regulatory protein